MTTAARKSDRIRGASAGLRAGWAMLAGSVTGAIISLFTLPAAAVLLGWDAAAGIYLAWAWASVWNLDSDLTARLASREDPRDAACSAEDQPRRWRAGAGDCARETTFSGELVSCARWLALREPIAFIA